VVAGVTIAKFTTFIPQAVVPVVVDASRVMIPTDTLRLPITVPGTAVNAEYVKAILTLL
jgi:hypothetical protein